MSEEKAKTPENGRNKDRYVKSEPPPEDLTRQMEQAGGTGTEPERDPETAFLADAARRAHDEELAALANLAIIRSTLFGRREGIREEPGRNREDLDRRLRTILNEPDQHGSGDPNRH